MTLTNALHAAIADPPDLEPLRSLEPPPNTMSPNPFQSLLVGLLRFWLCDYDNARLDRMRHHTVDSCLVLGGAGASDEDLCDVFSERAPSPEWNAAALRLAAWSDKQSTTNPDRVPAGYTRTDLPTDAPQGAVAAFTNGSVLVITGYVDDEDETHSCDAMGCGWDHVLERRV